MIFNYLKIAFRHLKSQKVYSVINILGLSTGIACCLLIMLFVKSEWSFDRFHSKADRLYRAWLEEHYEGQVFTNTITPIPLGPVIQEEIPEIATSCRVSTQSTGVKYNNTTFNDPVTITDSTFFDLFDFPLVAGNIHNPFTTSNSLIITENAAIKYFGHSSPLGKNLEIDLSNNKVLFTITGIVKNPPQESSIQFGLLIPFSNAHYVWSEHARTQAWSSVAVESFFLLKPVGTITQVNNKIPSVMDPLVAKTYKPGEYKVRLQPITDIHLNNKLPAGGSPVSDPKYSYILATVGFLILLIACINFITLSVGRSTTRALEVGIRKTLGAERRQLIRQFWGEAMLLTLFAVLIGTGFAVLLQKPFNQITNRELSLSFDWFTILYCFILAISIALLAGMYPAVVLSGFKPIQVLKGRLKMSTRMGFFGKALVTGQFVASIVLITGTLVVSRQLEYLMTKDLGYNKEHIVIVPTNKSRKDGNKLAAIFNNTIKKNPEVISSTTSLFSMAESGWMNLGYNDDQHVFRQFKFNAVDADFIPTMGLHVISGRSFSKDDPADSNYILVNEALVKEYGWKDPIGQRLPGTYSERVLGVVKDFNFESLHTGIKPAVMALRPDSIFRHSSDVSYDFLPEPRVSVRFRGGDLQQQISFLRNAWKSVAGDQDFEYSFLDDALNNAYQHDQRLSKIVTYGSVLSILIACMGLFGLATLVVLRRTKEIGIRKVLGASVGSILQLLSRDFVLLILIAIAIASPIAWWALHQWLQDFNYRIKIGWWMFGAAGCLALSIALVTVCIQAMRAALANPVKSLRTE